MIEVEINFSWFGLTLHFLFLGIYILAANPSLDIIFAAGWTAGIMIGHFIFGCCRVLWEAWG